MLLAGPASHPVVQSRPTVSGAQHIDRGYAGFAEAMQGLGADVTREPDDAPYL